MLVPRSVVRPALLLMLGGLLAFAGARAADPAPQTKPLRALFLGDRGLHKPAERFEQLQPVLRGRGIELTYTEKADDLNADTLGKYDALILYANIEKITPGQEKALLGYVAGGGGFVPLHCASFCFLNSPDAIALVGAQFRRHGTGTFDTAVVDASHPITKGLEPFRTWDETYVHAKHNEKDRHVLQTRDEAGRPEPWTWTRTQGKGRVFYTAYGHDARTWGHPGFHDLVERGIRWAANKGEVFDSRPRPHAGLKPFEYEPAEIPSYTPGARWGTLGEPSRKMQKPLPPEQSRRHLVMPEGFEAQLFATESDVGKPLTMTWDHLGRLYVASTVDYPNELQPQGKGRDRIWVAEDVSGDGRADRFSVFAEGLSIPTSLCYANDGLIVSQAPDMLFLKDTDGDGKADVRKVLFTGFGTRDTHAGPSNLKYGFDGWIYAIIGYSGFDGTVGGERHNFRQGFFRFRPDGSKLEFLRSTNNNSWGVGISEDNLLFGSTANGCPSVYMPIANRYYEKVRGMSPAVLANIADSNRFFPITENVRQVDWHGGFTAGAGSAIYTARTYPQQYWNRTAFVAEPTGHLVATFTLHPDGTDFRSHNAWNLVASDDEWTAPILAEVGPDGQVWVIDWYNFIVQHNPTPEGYKTGKGAAYETPLRDKTHGRIYRIVAKGGKPSPQPRLSKDDPKGLVAALKNENLFWRLHAQRLLVEKGDTSIVPDLTRLGGQADATGLDAPRLHAIWTLAQLGVVRPGHDAPNTAVKTAMDSPSPAVRRAAVQVMGNDAVVLAMGLKDADAQVRLAACLAASERGGSATSVLEAVLDPRNQNDRWMGDALTMAAAAQADDFFRALAKPKGDASLLAKVTAQVAEHYARGGAEGSIKQHLPKLADFPPAARDAFAIGLAKGWGRNKAPDLDEAATKALVGLMPKLAPSARVPMLGLAARWELKGLDAMVATASAEMLATASAVAKPDGARIEAARQLIELRRSDAKAAGDLIALVTPKSSPQLAAGLLGAVAQSQAPEVGPALANAVGSMAPAARKMGLLALLGRADWSASLVNAMEAGKIAPTVLSLDQSQALATNPDAKIASRMKALLARGGGLPDPDREKVIQMLSPVVMKGGDAARGKEVFKAQCAKCHAHSGEGGKVGPDLTGMAAHPRSELLIHILDPSRSVEGNFTMYNVSTADGRTLSGLLAGETRTTIEILDAEGKRQTVLRDDIDELAASKKSVMPEGFEKQVTPQALADLLQFLTQKGKYFALDLRKAATVNTTQPMLSDSPADNARIRFDDWGLKVVEGVPFALVDPQGDRVPNAVMLRGGMRGMPLGKLPTSVSLPVNASAKAIHLLGGVSAFGHPGGQAGSVSLIVRIQYEDGSTEDHDLKNGVHLADFNGPAEVPGSKRAFKLGGQQVRYLAIAPRKKATISSIELIKGSDRSAPIVLAATVEGFE